MSKCTSQFKRGFTLIEMLVSIGLFTVVMTISMGTLLTLIDANSRAQSIQIAVNNLSFALDSMTRQIRLGFDYYCAANTTVLSPGSGSGNLRTGVNDCTNNPGGGALAFTDTRTGNRIGFGTAGGGTTILRKVDGATSGEWLPLTGSNISVTELEFWVSGTDPALDGASETSPPTVTIYLEAEVADASGAGTTYEIQTTVVQRMYDF